MIEGYKQMVKVRNSKKAKIKSFAYIYGRYLKNKSSLKARTSNNQITDRMQKPICYFTLTKLKKKNY